MSNIAALCIAVWLSGTASAQPHSRIVSASVSPDFVAWSEGGTAWVNVELAFDLAPAGQCQYTILWGDGKPNSSADSRTARFPHEYRTSYPSKKRNFYIGVRPTPGTLQNCWNDQNIIATVQPFGTPPPPPKVFKHAPAGAGDRAEQGPGSSRLSRDDTTRKPGTIAYGRAPGAGSTKDAPDCADHPLFGRLQDYWIESCKQKPLDSYNFDAGASRSMIEGKYWYIRYLPPAGAAAKTTAQVLGDAAAIVERAGGVAVQSDSSKETFKLLHEGKELWIEVWADHTGKYILTIVEKTTG